MSRDCDCSPLPRKKSSLPVTMSPEWMAAFRLRYGSLLKPHQNSQVVRSGPLMPPPVVGFLAPVGVPAGAPGVAGPGVPGPAGPGELGPVGPGVAGPLPPPPPPPPGGTVSPGPR